MKDLIVSLWLLDSLPLFSFLFFSLSNGNVYLKKSADRIGPVYQKVVYRRYKDETFTELDARGPDEDHLGILGKTFLSCYVFDWSLELNGFHPNLSILKKTSRSINIINLNLMKILLKSVL